MNSTDTKPKSKAEREAEDKARRRAETAAIVAGLKQALAADEQLLGFARGRLAGGIRGKLSLGPEAFFAPFVNIGLTERRLVIQHINAETGRPGEILPHFYALGDIAAMAFSDIETFGGESAARLTVRLRNDQHTRLRLRGQGNFESAQAIVEVFRSLTSAKRSATTPTQRVCATCQHILDQPFKFCPYCGQLQDLSAAAPVATPTAEAEPERTYPHTPPGATEPEFLDTVPYQDFGAFRGPTVEDGLDFLKSDPTPQPTVVPEPEPVASPEPAPEPEPSASPEPETPAAPETEAVTSAASEEDSAFETPSAFEGWPVDPGASAAVAVPSAEAEVMPPAHDYTPEAFAASGPSMDTEASVVETPLEEAHAHSEPAAATESQTDVYSAGDSAVLAVPPAAAYASVPEPEPIAAATAADFSWPSPAAEAAQEREAVSETEASPAAPVEFDAPSAFESFSEPAPSAEERPEFADPVPAAAAPAHESAGFVTEPAVAEGPAPVFQDFEPFAPMASTLSISEPVVSPETAEAMPMPAPLPDTVPVAAETVTLLTAPEPLPEAPPAPSAAVSPSEDRFAALLKEIRGGDAPEPSIVEPSAAVKRCDGPMSVKVHIDRAPIVVNETFIGQNADAVVGKLKQRVLPELNFALRLMVNSFSNLRFAQEIVHRYNMREKTSYLAPNSCWEFLLNAEEMGYVTIQLDR